MCGIAGILNQDRTTPDLLLLRGLCNQLVHRGPDDEGYHVEPGIALGQRRLSIIDLSSGRQPMSNEDGTVWVTFNGEIYNYQELRNRLEDLGHRFATHSDTETIVHAYEQYGADCINHFRGMFAFAVWDRKGRRLLLARDRVGKKPLFYTVLGQQFLFASELQALLQHPGVSRQADRTALDDYLTYGYVPAPKTGFAGIWKLPPAHYLTVSFDASLPVSGPLPAQRYWRLEFGPKLTLSEEEAVEGLLEVLSEAVRLRLIADVPLGALLSGGVDSSIVVALMSQLSSRAVRTFSIGFEEDEFNELPYARLVAERYRTEHHELIVRPDALDLLPKLIRHYGEPYADSSAVPSYYVAKLTRQHVTVALNGDGGDECFAGYERYLGSVLADRLSKVPRWLRAGVSGLVSVLIPNSLPRRHRLGQLKRFLKVAGQPFAQRYLRWVTYFTAEAKQQFYTAEMQAQLTPHRGEDWLLGQLQAVAKSGMSGVDALLAVDTDSYLPYDLLVKMDIAAMANSLEARSPFLDHKLMEFAARLPAHFKLRGKTLKYLLKRVGSSLLPAENLHRRKMGFGVPVGEWMRHRLRPLVEDLLLAPDARIVSYLRPEAVSRLVRAHTQGTQDNSSQLWALLCLELWHREFRVAA